MKFSRTKLPPKPFRFLREARGENMLLEETQKITNNLFAW